MLGIEGYARPNNMGTTVALAFWLSHAADVVYQKVSFKQI